MTVTEHDETGPSGVSPPGPDRPTPRGARRRRSHGAPAPAARFEPGRVADARHRNPTWVVAGVLLVVLSALGGVVLFTSSDKRTDVLVAAIDLEPGRALTTADLRIERVAIDGDVRSIPAGEAGELVGQHASGRIPAGSMLSPAMFETAVALGPDEVVIGAALDPGRGADVADRGRRHRRAARRDGRCARRRRRASRPCRARRRRRVTRHRHRVGRRAPGQRAAVAVGARRSGGRPHRLGDVGDGPAARGADRRWRVTVIAIGSVAGSPGATSLALGLAAVWPDSSRARVVVEADPDGGRLGAELGIGVEPGLMALALAVRTADITGAELISRAAALIGDWQAIPAPASSEQTSSALVHAAAPLAAVMADDDAPVWLVDVGRLSARSSALPFAKVAAHTLVVTRGSFPALQLIPHRIEALRAAGCAPSVVVVEPTSWPIDEIAGFVTADVVAVLPLVHGARPGVAGMRTSAWRPWWRRVEDAASYLDANERAEVAR